MSVPNSTNWNTKVTIAYYWLIESAISAKSLFKIGGKMDEQHISNVDINIYKINNRSFYSAFCLRFNCFWTLFSQTDGKSRKCKIILPSKTFLYQKCKKWNWPQMAKLIYVRRIIEISTLDVFNTIFRINCCWSAVLHFALLCKVMYFRIYDTYIYFRPFLRMWFSSYISTDFCFVSIT